MSERSGDSGDLTSGDPLGGGTAPEAPRHESGLPGYTSPPPPGAGGPVAPTYGQQAPALGGRYVLAGWWSRVGAQIVDGILISVVALVLFLPLGAAFGVGFADDSDATVWAAVAGLLLWVLCVGIIALLYAPAMMARTNGKTLGRMVTNIRVVRTSGEPITFGFAMLREVVVKTIGFGIAGAFTGGIANLVDVLWPLWDEENRALHDFVVNTRVVKD
jgi:uncharacterized RDD family membrane protein YckC